MEDGDDDTSPTVGLKHNGKPNSDENNVTTENEDWKESFSSEGRSSPFSSQEGLSHSESIELDKEDNISDQDSKNKSSEPFSDANTPVVLEDNVCDKIQKFVESEPAHVSEVSITQTVIEPSDEVVHDRGHSEFLGVPSEVSDFKPESSGFASVESTDYAHETETNENKEQNSSFDENVSTSSEVQTTDGTPDTSLTQNDSIVKSETGEEEDLSRSLVLPCSVTANGSGDVSTGSDINLSDSNSEVHDESFEEVASQKYKDTSETFDSSSNINVSFQNEPDSSDSSISQNSANNTVSQPDGHNSCCEETPDTDRVDVSEPDSPEPEQERFSQCEPLSVNEDGNEHLGASEESESVREEELHGDQEEEEKETEICDSVKENDGGENCMINDQSDIDFQMKHHEDEEEMEVDSYEWKNNELELCSVARTERIDETEEMKENIEANEERNDEMCVDDGSNSNDEIERSQVEKQQYEEMDEDIHKDKGKETLEDIEQSEYEEVQKETCANVEENVDDGERDVQLEAQKESRADVEEENEKKEKDEYLEAREESHVNIGIEESGGLENVTENESCVSIGEDSVEPENYEFLEEDKVSHVNVEENRSEELEKDVYSEEEKECPAHTDEDEMERDVLSEVEHETCSTTEEKNREEMEISDKLEGIGGNTQILDLEDSLSESEEGEQTQESQKSGIVRNADKFLDSYSTEHKEKATSMTSSGQSSPTESYLSSKDTFTETGNNVSECIKKSGTSDMDVDESSMKVNGEIECKQGETHEIQEPIKEKLILKRKREESPTSELLSDDAVSESCKMDVSFKGFKKRYIAQVSEAEMKCEDESPTVNEDTKLNNTSVKTVIMEPTQVIVSHQQIGDREESDTPLTEYAQYLGLQPTVKFKCYNCGESGFPSMMNLQEHQNTCLKNDNSQCLNKPPPSPSPEPLPSTNFRITRKVYLCSACGTYYENWNLFIHMKEVHNRHICLFCLVMFSQAEKLAGHLLTKHGISEGDFDTPQDFLNEFNGAFFVMCCTCEQLFNESDNFFDHPCGNVVENVADQACSLCGLRGAHFPTCRRAFTDSSAVTSPPHNPQSTVPNSELPPSVQTVQEKAPKYLGSTDKSSNRKSHQKQPDKNNASEKRNRSDYCEDDYDISDAASYCHVNIDEPEKQKNLNSSICNENNKESCEAASDSKKPSNDFNDVVKKDADPCESEISNYTAEEINRNESCDLIRDSPSDLPEQEPENNTEKEVSQSSESIEPVICHDTSNDTKSPTLEPQEPADFADTLNSAKKEIDSNVETPSLNHSKSPKEGDSESDTSASAGDTRGSDDSSSGSEVSSDENEVENKEPSEVVKATASDESDGDKSDSDKMSIVVDDTRSDDEVDKEEKTTDCNTASTANENIVNDVDDCKTDAELDITMNEEKSEASNNDSEDQQDNIQIAGDDVPLLELTLEETMDSLPIQAVVKECVKISCGTCVYCNHAKKIAVNGKQLVLHILAEHRYEPVVCSDSGELTPITGFVENLKAKLAELQDMYFNTDSYDSADKTFTKPYDRTYECFHCHFITTLHKELYVHNRKMHQKTILLCIMCKSNFYSYSELLCHLCPGIYVPDSNISFRCCLCVVDGLPSAFRLMVHLRKRHHACDVCLETTGDQQKLSNHVWKHKLHHLCYRCGIAYRNKPDITKHLFWKHGTESVLCKKCLQKKWPHVYHFCIPPTAFLCEECNASFSRAVALKVHKRLHVGDIAYECDECQEKFISKKLLRRHKDKHKQADEEEERKIVENIHENKMGNHDPDKENITNEQESLNQGGVDAKAEEMESHEEHTANIGQNHKMSGATEDVQSQPVDSETNKRSDETTNKRSKVVDVYDLPPLNLSSESDDSEDESANKKASQEVDPEDSKIPSTLQTEESPVSKPSQEGETQTEEETQPVEIVDGVWDNFKNYKANLEKREILQAQVCGSLKTTEISSSLPSSDLDCHAMMDIVLADHDYCIVPEKTKENAPNPDDIDDSLKKVETLHSEKDNILDDKGDAFGADHNYCYNTSPGPEERKESIEAVVQPPVVNPSQTPPPQLSSQILSVPAVSTPTSTPKKKQKSPKKKQKQSGSSSSSDSSSNSDSSSCTCGTNCSCSSSSSSSSGSSSSSSDSDSSSSEGRRRQAARRERRRERAKRKLDTESRGGSPPVTAVESQANQTLNSAPTQIDSSGGLLQVDDGPPTGHQEPEESEFTIRESDLDTTETETDEDFYDKYPQRQANKLLAEKRNQLLLLAAVAPVNNGTLNQPRSPPPAPPVELPEPVQKKKGKTKRHKKAQHHIAEKKVENKLKLNIPASYYSSPSFSVGNPHLLASPIVNSQNAASSHTSRISSHETFSPAPEAASTPSAYHSTGSGSETESKRLSKRKRIPKKFYGDSSDEEAEHSSHQPYKWRKVVPNTNSNPPPAPAPVSSVFTFRNVNASVLAPEPVQATPLQTKSDDDGDDSDSAQEAKRSSSDSSNSDSDNEHSEGDSDVETAPSVTNMLSSVSGNINQQKNENLYCYCQCPYDEVSEMIACDGKDCSIEWFHFECVGIMVPPKGKWFCPDCRKKTAARSEYLLHA